MSEICIAVCIYGKGKSHVLIGAFSSQILGNLQEFRGFGLREKVVFNNEFVQKSIVLQLLCARAELRACL